MIYATLIDSLLNFESKTYLEANIHREAPANQIEEQDYLAISVEFCSQFL